MAVYDVTTAEKKASPSLVAGGTLYADNPLGTILPFGGSDIPSGWLLCNGDQISKTDYAELYAIIGDSFQGAKADPTSGNFYLPDLREVTLKGVGTNYAYAINNHGTIGNVGGFMEDRVQEHTHTFSDSINGVIEGMCRAGTGATYGAFSAEKQATWAVADWQSGGAWTDKITLSDTISGTTSQNSGRSGNTTEVKSVGVNYIIKAKMASVPADFLAKVDEAVEDVMNIETGTFADGNGKYEKSGHTVRYVYQPSDIVSAGTYTLSIPYAPIALFANVIFWGSNIVGHVAVQSSAKTMSLEIVTGSLIHVEAIFITAD